MAGNGNRRICNNSLYYNGRNVGAGSYRPDSVCGYDSFRRSCALWNYFILRKRRSPLRCGDGKRSSQAEYRGASDLRHSNRLHTVGSGNVRKCTVVSALRSSKGRRRSQGGIYINADDRNNFQRCNGNRGNDIILFFSRMRRQLRKDSGEPYSRYFLREQEDCL